MSFERIVALKVVHEHLSEENEFISQFLDEANLLVRLAHPNIVQVHELGREGETLYLAMEYLHGQPLSKLMSVLKRQGGRLSPVLVAWVGARVAEGLGYAHRLTDDTGSPLGVVHRDVSPQNVFVTYDASVKLIDFGIARAKGRIAQTTLGRIKGKFSYMAPEQVLGKDFDHRADIFALGATLYEAALGARLFAGVDESETLHKLLFEEVPDIQTRVPEFPGELSKILQRTLASNPDDRYPTCDELTQALDAWVAQQGGEPQKELAELLAQLFESERVDQNRAIETLRADQTPTLVPSDPARESPSSTPSGYRTLPAPAKSRRLAMFAGIGVGVLAIVGAVVALSSRNDPTPSPAASASAKPASTNVVVEVVTQPVMDAKITLGGEPLSGKPARISRVKGSDPLTLVVEADGYQPAKLEIVPDRDRSVVVPMVAKPPPPPLPSAEPKKTTGAKPGTTHVQGSVKGKGGSKGKGKGDPLVTDYPF